VEIVLNFKHNVNDLVDCRVQCIRDIIEYHSGYHISSTMCFGLGEGLDFLYWQETKTKIPVLVILGRSLNCEQTLCQKMDLNMAVIKPDTEDLNTTSNMELIYFINKQKPVMVDVDRYFLDYLAVKFGRSHFGFHSLLIVGYRNVDDLEFALYDFLSNDLIWFPSSKLSLARTSAWQPFAPERKFYTFNTKHIRSIDSKLISCSIEANCKKLLNCNGKSGIAAMSLLSDEILGLVQYMNSSQSMHVINLQIKLIVSYIKEFESSGTFYRRIYSNFLKEASEFEGLGDLEGFSCELSVIADKWDSVVKYLTLDVNTKDKIIYLGNELKQISNSEFKLLNELITMLPR